MKKNSRSILEYLNRQKNGRWTIPVGIHKANFPKKGELQLKKYSM